MVGIYIYIDGVSRRIELFQDENITMVSSIQNLNDIGKTYTDYTQSFTIPASAVNNSIFSHWYENALDDGFDHRIKYYGYIEIDSIPFRDGKFQMEKANVKNGNVESYSITFIGNLVQLKDRFKEDKLNTLSYLDGSGIRVSYYDALNHSYTFSEVQDRIENAGYDVAYPLLGSSRRFLYGLGASAQDITQTAGAVKYNELFPAIPVSKILEYIQDCYGITFESVFLSTLVQ